MDYIDEKEFKQISKWYLSPYFSIVLSCFWIFYGIPLILAIILQVIRQRKIKKLMVSFEPFINHQEEIHSILSFEEEINNKTKELNDLNSRFISKENDLNIKYTDKTADLEKAYEEKEKNLSTSLNASIKNLKIELEDLKNKRNDLQEELQTFESKALSANFDFTDFDNITSEEYKNKLSISHLSEKKDLKKGYLISTSSNNDKKFISNNIKQITRLFNAECDSIMNKVTAKNIDTSRNKITRSFNSLNKIFETDEIQLTDKWLSIKLEQLNIIYLYEMKKTQEKEIQKAIREQMIEEEKVRREIEKQKQKLEKDQKQFNNEITRMMKYLQKTSNDAEKELYLDKIKELEEKIKDLEAEKKIVLEREANAKAGYVYIISNIGSFGENVYKIGMTRRLEPMERIKELSSASVPFEFDVHAMIFSENAPELENTLHQTFKENSVNKVNYRKEFFKVSLDEIEEVVKKNYNNTVDFIKVPVATEYRQTLEIENNKR